MDMPEAERRISAIETKLDNLPDIIANKISETMDLKIKVAVAQVENKFQGKINYMLFLCIGELVGLVVSFITGAK